MKMVSTLFVLAAFGVSFIMAKEVVAVIPATPKIGDKITITYDQNNPASGLKEAKELTAQILIMRSEKGGKVLEYPMERKNGIWKTTFVLDEKSARVLLLRFTDGTNIDDNNKNVWHSLVYGKNNKPLRDAQYLRSLVFRFPYNRGFIHGKDIPRSQKDIDGELAIYPDNIKAVGARWDIAFQASKEPATLKMIKSQLDAQLKKNAAKEGQIDQLLVWVERVYSKEKADSIRTSWISKNPTGLIAESTLRGQVLAERDSLKRIELAEKYLSVYPSKEEYLPQFVNMYVRARQHEQAAELLGSMKNPNPSAYNTIAWRHIEKDEKLEQAVAWAKTGFDLVSRDPKSTKPEHMTMKDWLEEATYNKGSLGDTYAYGLMKLGRYDEANKIFEEVYASREGSDEEVNVHYVECLTRSGKNEKALEIAFASVAKGMANQQLVDMYKTAYTTVKGTNAGFDSVYAIAKNEAIKGLKSKLKKEIVDKPSIDFELKSIDGTLVKLSDLKGKVVVLDFWATWCGPCLASFPSLQKVYDKYKENPNVMILAMNTWERVKPEEREQHVKNFMEKNKYTFPVLFDTDIVSKYEVEGIPTKFIIDQNGRVRFKDVGFGGAQEMEDKMNLQFEMLLSGDLSLSGQ